MTSCRISLALAIAAALAPMALAACSSSSPNFQSGDDASTPEPEGGGSSSGSSSGSSGSTSSSSGATHDSGSGSSSSGAMVASNITFNSAGIPMCGSTACDLKSNECCLSAAYIATCNPQSAACTGQAVFKCVEAAECPQGQVCCGLADQTTASAGASCQTTCTTGASSTMGSAQLCQTDAECKNGMKCIWQDCKVGMPEPSTANVELTMCGVQSASPFNCTAH